MVSLELDVRDEGDVPLVVMRVRRLLATTPLSGEDQGRIGTVCSELAQNIAKYAEHGTIRVEAGPAAGGWNVRVQASDRGPGIADLDAALRDHFSSSGSLGLGLPGIGRMMTSLEVSSEVGVGTRVLTERLCILRAGSR
jgi:serine/threonine-protein kinase RsbT